MFAVNRPLRELIRVAYGLEENQVVGAAALLDAAFDVDARSGPNTTPAEASLMFRALLADRFALKTHTEMRPLPVFTLSRESGRPLGPPLTRAATDCAPPALPKLPEGVPPPPPPPPAVAGAPLSPEHAGLTCPAIFFNGHISARSMTMQAFARVLARLVRRPVIDRTELAGAYDFDVTYTPDPLAAPGMTPSVLAGPGAGAPAIGPPVQNSGPSLTTAIRDQLGLRLDSSRAPVEVLVIDSVQAPTEN